MSASTSAWRSMKTLSHAELRKVKAALPDLYKMIREQQSWIRHWSKAIELTRQLRKGTDPVIKTCNVCGDAFLNQEPYCEALICPHKPRGE